MRGVGLKQSTQRLQNEKIIQSRNLSHSSLQFPEPGLASSTLKGAKAVTAVSVSIEPEELNYLMSKVRIHSTAWCRTKNAGGVRLVVERSCRS